MRRPLPGPSVSAATDGIATVVDHLRSRLGESADKTVHLARSGNQNAAQAFEQAAAIIGTALATMANLVGPDVILVMGESVSDYDLYEQRIRQSFDLHTFGSAGQCKIITRSHTFEDWARGAAASVIRAAVTKATA